MSKLENMVYIIFFDEEHEKPRFKVAAWFITGAVCMIVGQVIRALAKGWI